VAASGQRARKHLRRRHAPARPTPPPAPPPPSRSRRPLCGRCSRWLARAAA
jgi:hypothetical protein